MVMQERILQKEPLESSAFLAGLPPSTVYYYVYGGATNSTERELRTTATTSGSKYPFRIAAVADLGQVPPNQYLYHSLVVPAQTRLRLSKASAP